MRTSALRIVSCGVLAGLLLACGAPTKKTSTRRLPDSAVQEQPSAVLARPMPWEIWAPFKDLDGQDLQNRALILGDELQQQGKRRSALESYLRAASEALPPNENAVAVLRIASQQLALDEPKKALSAIGAYYKRKGLGEANVDVPFGLVLAFAYGRHRDIEQSLAWFSKVATQGRMDGPAIQVARNGTGLLLRTLTTEDFERVATNWFSDAFINEQIGRERLRRSSPGFSPSEQGSKEPFWATYDTLQSTPLTPPGSLGVAGKPVVGVVLSLSSRFAAIGRDTRQGLELAVERGNTTEPKISVMARDVGSDTAAASAAVRELVASGGATVIAGPLLTEPSVAAAQTAREVGVPLVSFSKSESFTTGGGIFRLGATTTSQIEALVNAAYGEYHLTRFAVAYPQTASGAEFVEVFKRKLSSLGLTLELEIAYVAGNEASMLNVAQQLDGSAAEAVLIPDTIESSERFISSLSPTVKKRIRPLGTALWDNAQKIARSQALFERSIFVTPFFTQSVRPEVQQFMEAYRAKYSAAPNFLAAQGFDAGILLVNALRKSAESAQPFDRALSQATPLQGVTGAIAVLPSGEIQRSFYVVEVLRDSFQEKLPSSSVTRFDPTAPTAPGIAQSSTPRLGDGERVESGY